MKVLFICRANVGRSQIAEAMFNSISKKHKAISAGLNPPEKWEGQKLSKTKFVAPSMIELDYNVDEKISKKITNQMVDEAGKIIVIGEKDGWPDYLKKSDQVSFWDVEDPDKGGLELHRRVRDQIKSLIEDLVKEIG
ncbi:MAG: low molecular weight phosphatase family protein [Nanoarchaeota archaeon]|nr:low molecular weight phosphatase family protein [Nanoarchaeota archaeon]